MVQETLFDLLSLHHGCFIFEMGPPLTPQLMTLPIAPLTARIAKQVQEWKQFYPHLQSPDQCPVMTDAAAMSQVLPKGTVSTLLRYGDGKTSVRQLSHYLNREILTVAQAIYPCVQRGWVHFTQPSPPKSAVGFSPIASPTNADAQPFTPPVIACLDDAPTIRETVEVMLTQHGYEVAGLADPIEALSQMFKIAPNLILCDITMPNLDGYEVCAMLRQSTVFRQTPIIMLTGKDGFIDRVKARMVGATDYLAKPFGEEELVMLVEKYVGGGSAQMISPSHRGRGLQTVSANLAD
jgi:twitching motility two-component system response regulator PilG